MAAIDNGPGKLGRVVDPVDDGADGVAESDLFAIARECAGELEVVIRALADDEIFGDIEGRSGREDKVDSLEVAAAEIERIRAGIEKLDKLVEDRFGIGVVVDLVDDEANIKWLGDRGWRFLVGAEALQSVLIKPGNGRGIEGFVVDGKIIEPAVEVAVVAAGVVTDPPVTVVVDRLGGNAFGSAGGRSVDVKLHRPGNIVPDPGEMKPVTGCSERTRR